MTITDRRSQQQYRSGVHWRATECTEEGGGSPFDPTRECFDRAFAHHADKVLGQSISRVDLADRVLQLVERVVRIPGEIDGLLCQRSGRWRGRQPRGTTLWRSSWSFITSTAGGSLAP